jgi:hypothetical protein
MSYHVKVKPGMLVEYEGLAYVNANFNEPEFGSQPYVTINTEPLPDQHSNDDGCPLIAVHLNDATIYDDEGAGPIHQSDTPKTDRFKAMEVALETIKTTIDNSANEMGDVHRVVMDQLQELGMYA